METRTQNNWIDAFLAEAEDLLAEIEESALALNEDEAVETTHRIFRAFHTIKGSSGMCGFTAVADFTHHIETLLDKVRAGEVAVTSELGNLVLAGRDQVRDIIAAEQGGAQVAEGSSEKLVERFKAFAGVQEPILKLDTSDLHAEVLSLSPRNFGELVWEIRFRPHLGLFTCGGNPILLMRDLSTLGSCEVTTHTDAVPPLEEIDPHACYLWWSATLRTSAGRDTIRDVFMFVEDGSELEIRESGTGTENHAMEVVEDGAQNMAVTGHVQSAEAEAPSISDNSAAHKVGAAEKTLAKESTVRVPAGRLDRLVNLVGELVMNQSRLKQITSQIGAPELANPVQEIERLVAELRDDVLGIRMLPIGTLFGRFRRLVHDLSLELEREVDLITEGAETELDKSILDQLGEPLVHLLRNSIDHGIELAEERLAKGKPRRGTIRLNASHMGANVVVSIEDDGHGISRRAVRDKAIEKQLISPDANLSDRETLNLLLLPGFSTAKKVTNISGRGVGMDVVKRQIDQLRGSVQIASEEGKGTNITLTLPLTLAIIEGLLVQVAENRFILPMCSVTENVELPGHERKTKNGRNVFSVRGNLLPYVDLRALFQIAGDSPEIERIVIVKHEEQRVGFVVDRVLGTHQTVLQPLGRFLRNVTVASGSTIMGDGGVALILDIASIINLADQHAREGCTALTLRTA
jgi:two-component system chemotaxis sensor kinase CheA